MGYEKNGWGMRKMVGEGRMGLGGVVGENRSGKRDKGFGEVRRAFFKGRKVSFKGRRN